MPGGSPMNPQQQGLMQRMFGWGGQAPGQNMMGLGAKLLQASGQGMNFGQGLGTALSGQLGEARQLEQQAFANNLATQQAKRQEAVAKAQAEYQKQMLQAQEERAKQAADMALRSDELALRRWEAGQAADNERTRMINESRERIASENQTIPMDLYDLRKRASGGDTDADQAYKDYLSTRSSNMWGLGNYPGGPPGGDADAADMAAVMQVMQEQARQSGQSVGPPGPPAGLAPGILGQYAQDNQGRTPFQDIGPFFR